MASSVGIVKIRVESVSWKRADTVLAGNCFVVEGVALELERKTTLSLSDHQKQVDFSQEVSYSG